MPVMFLIGCLITDFAVAAELRFDARKLAEKALGQNIRLAPDGSAIILDRGDLFEDDGPAAGYSYKPNEEKLSSQVWIKKELLIADPFAEKATLLVAPGGDLRAIINGKAVELKSTAKAGQYWQIYSIPVESLKSGKNEIVLHGTGKIWIARAEDFAAGSRTRDMHPNRSARSTDNGKTWDYDRLGAAGDIDGEYCVRVHLDRIRSHGFLTLPVVDVANLTGHVIAPNAKPDGAVRVRVDAKDGQVKMRARSGSTLQPRDKDWSEWRDVEKDATLRDLAGRFVQIEIKLTATDPRETPKLKQVAIESPDAPAADWVRKLRVIENDNPEIVRSTIPFEYERWDHPTLAKLRRDCKLDDVANGAKDEFELITRLAAWSEKQWERGHLKDSYPPWDATKILELHTDGTPVGGFCQQYNVVFLQACESFGIPGRAVSIGPSEYVSRIRGGHEVVELWSNQHRKWVYVDGQAAWYFADGLTGTPLSLLELRERQLQTFAGKSAKDVRVVPIAETKFKWTGLEQWPPFVELRMIPRSNFLGQASPLPLNQGMRGWFWTGHHAWTDDEAPALLLYSQRCRRKGDWEWTLNQARILLTATDRAGELRVQLDTETPGFDTYLDDIDGKGWQKVVPKFVWKLQPGKNRLQVRPRNTAGCEGIVSKVVIEQ
jgi:transglutaminase-like putative cysteine protease